uniref:Uncharacterized protein n=1 Tax=Knipowitschia caucasica TaxID=637954 RepID=A0AAV2J7H5_KNICA
MSLAAGVSDSTSNQVDVLQPIGKALDFDRTPSPPRPPPSCSCQRSSLNELQKEEMKVVLESSRAHINTLSVQASSKDNDQFEKSQQSFHVLFVASLFCRICEYVQFKRFVLVN